VEALLHPDEAQPYFSGGSIKILLDRKDAERTMHEDHIPAALVQLSGTETKTQRLKHTKPIEKDYPCFRCQRKMAEHESSVTDDCIECATCEEWFHYTCSGLTTAFYFNLIEDIASWNNSSSKRKNGECPGFICSTCRRSNGKKKRGKIIDVGRRERDEVVEVMML
jgi:hypothetical protein